jgi:hypothetical protein
MILTNKSQYYKPWKLTHDDEERIIRQVDQATEQVAQEREQFEQRRANAQPDEDLDGENSPEQTDPSRPNRDGEETTTLEIMEDVEATSIVNDPPQNQLDDDDDDEHHGETVLETQEDTVIY